MCYYAHWSMATTNLALHLGLPDRCGAKESEGSLYDDGGQKRHCELARLKRDRQVTWCKPRTRLRRRSQDSGVLGQVRRQMVYLLGIPGTTHPSRPSH
jgi:hypothetical protein